MIKIIYTDGCNPDFVALCRLLDDNLNEIVGGTVQRAEYDQFNQLNSIHDVVLIYSDGIPAACGSFKRYDEGIAEIKRVFVKPAFRGQGFSKVLIGELEEKARNAGYEMLYLETGDVLTAAHSLYKSVGFRVRKNYGPYEQMEKSICMEKRI